ncbi:S8 family serine peptidase [Geobacillus thermodenitrificans]|uniref:S8 family serine peptidase n=1 Tax=Geobacillus thermodenitrificans TaxID=33940 RepID=UPI0034C68E8A
MGIECRDSVNIAVVDSGVNPYHSHVNGIDGGVALRVNREGWIEYYEDFRDRLGHGTAVVAVFKHLLKEARIFIVKIFDEKLATYPSVLCEALYWCIHEKIDIVNLSLGMEKDDEQVREACRAADEAGVSIIAAYDEKNGLCWPARYETVFGVCAGEASRDEWGFITDKLFYACGYPRELPGELQLHNIYGHSFAAAHFSAFVAQLLMKNPNWNSKDVRLYFQELYQNKNSREE